LEDKRKNDMAAKLEQLDFKAEDFRKKLQEDQRMKQEWDKLRRREKEDSVKRKERQASYERELRQRRIEEEQRLQAKLRQDQEEIENYKRQLRDNARFKKELIQKSFDVLHLKSKSPVFFKKQKAQNDSHRSATTSLPEILQSPKQYSQHVK